MDWEHTLSPEERREWERFVRHVREDAARKIADSAFVMSLFPEGEPDIKFAVETGLAILYDKPIVLLVMAGAQVPEHLRRVADGIVELHGDLDTEEGQAEAQAKLRPFMERFAS
jgi:hypothetical protein